MAAKSLIVPDNSRNIAAEHLGKKGELRLPMTSLITLSCSSSTMSPPRCDFVATVSGSTLRFLDGCCIVSRL